MRRASLLALISAVSAVAMVASFREAALAQEDPHDPTHLGATAPVPDPAEPVLSAEETARRAQVVARIGEGDAGITLTLGEVEDEINAMSPFVRARYRDENRLREYVENMVRLELLGREAETRGYGDDPEVRRTTLESAVQHMIRTEIDERITAASISEAEVLVYYEAHPEEFSRPEMRRASHILVATREEALALLERARGGDMRGFRALAQELSQDTETRSRGGDLRYFDAQGRGPNTADPAVEAAISAAAFGLAAVGDLSEPVEVNGRFSVVKLTGIRPAEHRSVADSGDAIRMRLFRQRRETALDDMVTRLRASIPTEVFYERMANLRMEPPARGSVDPEHGEAAVEEGAEGEGAEGEAPSLDPLRPPPSEPIPGITEPAEGEVIGPN